VPKTGATMNRIESKLLENGLSAKAASRTRTVNAPSRMASRSPALQPLTETPSGSSDDRRGQMNHAFEDELRGARFNVAKLARACGLSVRQLEREFHKQLGACPRETIRQLRMALARDHLLSGAPLKQIADQLDYRHSAHFSRAFKAHYGTSPMEMRRALLPSWAAPCGCRLLV